MQLIPKSNWSTAMMFVLMTQFAAFVFLAFNIITMGKMSTASIIQMPPINFLYSAGDVVWMSSGMTIAFAIMCLTNIILGGVTIFYGISRKLKLIKYATISMGLLFLFNAMSNASLVGAFASGGWWHIYAFVATIVATIVATATMVIFVAVQKGLRVLGQAHDAHIGLTSEQQDAA